MLHFEGHTQFDRMGLSAERQKTYLKTEIELLREELEAAIDENGDKSFSVKQIEKSISSYEDRLKKLDDKQEKDDFIDFEQLGFDHIFLDESQNYKNLATATNVDTIYRRFCFY
jgi:N12 class adenine-specific DNA methylase